MTTPGPDHFFSCPYCEIVLHRKTTGSGNTFGSRLWSDGYLGAPMLPGVVRATRCPSCEKPFLVDDAKDLGYYWIRYKSHSDDPDKPTPVGYENAPIVENADIDALSDLIMQTDDKDRLRYLLVKKWHTYNHPDRSENVDVVPEMNSDLNKVLERLVDLFGTPVQDAVSKIEDSFEIKDIEAAVEYVTERFTQDLLIFIEALRELGKHAEVIEFLDVIQTLEASRKFKYIDEDYTWAVDQIRVLAQAGISKVSVLLRPGEER